MLRSLKTDIMVMSNAAKEWYIYEPRTLAKGLGRVSSDIVKTPSTDLIVKWYRAAHVDLQIWIDKAESKIIRQQFSFLGQIVEWNHMQGLKSGYILDKPEACNDKNISPLKVVYDKKYVPGSVEQAIEVLSYAENLLEKDEILSNYRNYPVISKWRSFILVSKHLWRKIKNTK